MPPSTVDQVTSLDLAASVDPIIVSADPVIRRASANAFRIQNTTPIDILTVSTLVPRVTFKNFSNAVEAIGGSRVHTAMNGENLFVVDVYDNVQVPTFIVRKARGTRGAPSSLLSGDNIGSFSFRGYGATAFSSGSRIRIVGIAAENWTDVAQGTNLDIQVTPPGGTATATKWSFRGNGDLRMDGNFNLIPLTDNNGSVGTATNRFTLVRAVTITAGDLTFENGWRFTEDYLHDGMILKDKLGHEIFAVRKDGLYYKGKRIVGDGKGQINPILIAV
jgi:hypothetical protein